MDTILKGQPNFRDLGGVTTKSGQRVKENKIFRSGYIGTLDESDLSALKKLNVGEILDLRTTEEINLIGQGDYPAFIDYKNIALNTGNISKFLIPIFEKGEFHLLDPNILDQIYIDLVTKFKPELAAIFRELINTDEGIVYHCSHGKDRTGVISALLLDYLEVDRELIYKDYLQSNDFLKNQTQQQLQMIKDNFTKRFQREISEEELAPVTSLFFCREEILESVFDYIDHEYGTVENYFQKELGLSASELELLKSNYLE